MCSTRRLASSRKPVFLAHLEASIDDRWNKKHKGRERRDRDRDIYIEKKKERRTWMNEQIKKAHARRARNKAGHSYDVRRPSPENNRMGSQWMWSKLAGIAFAYVRHLHGPTPRATRARGTCDPRLLCRWGAGPAGGCSGSQPSGVRAQTASLVGVGAQPGGPQWRGQMPFGRSRSYSRCLVGQTNFTYWKFFTVVFYLYLWIIV